MTADNYCIRADYVALEEANTREESPGDYWTAERIRTSTLFQYHVYQEARALLQSGTLAGKKVADVGCGFAIKAITHIKPVCERLDLFDQPSLRPVIHKHYPDVNFYGIDLETEYESGADYDMVICADVIEHLLNPDECIEFLKKLVNPEGHIILSTPERIMQRGPECLTSPKKEHVREWSKDEFASYLTSRGLSVREHKLVPVRKFSVWEMPIQHYLPGLLPKRLTHGCQYVRCTLG